MHNQNTHTGPSFSRRNRLMRVIWNVTYWLLFRPTPNPMHRWRLFLLKIFGARVEAGVHIYPKAIVWAPWNLTLKSQCGIANNVILYSQGKITIGRRAVVSQGSHLCAGTHDYEHPGFPLITRPIVIEDYAWVAAEAFIHPGVTIGEGCVIGARSVVGKNMPAWMICSGFPCKPIRERIAPDQIEKFRTQIA